MALAAAANTPQHRGGFWAQEEFIYCPQSKAGTTLHSCSSKLGSETGLCPPIWVICIWVFPPQGHGMCRCLRAYWPRRVPLSLCVLAVACAAASVRMGRAVCRCLCVYWPWCVLLLLCVLAILPDLSRGALYHRVTDQVEFSRGGLPLLRYLRSSHAPLHMLSYFLKALTRI